MSEDWDFDKTKWHVCIDNEKLFKEYARILKFNGRIILFSQEPYTRKLRSYKNAKLIQFNYPMIWKKNHFGNPLSAKFAPLSYFEDINIFTKTSSQNSYKELRKYFAELKEEFEITAKVAQDVFGNYKARACLSTDSLKSFRLCLEETYNKLVKNFGVDNWINYKPYNELKELKEKYKKTFNISEGKNHVPNVLEFSKDCKPVHPTQKPVALLEFLIKVYSNENDTVLDSCMGSGSTGIAAQNTNRKFVGFEMDKDFYDIAKNRIEKNMKLL